MAWYKTLIQFWGNNLERNVKRISIALGSFIIFMIVLLPIPDLINGAVITLSSIIVMSIFGKNGNGNSEEKESEEPSPE